MQSYQCQMNSLMELLEEVISNPIQLVGSHTGLDFCGPGGSTFMTAKILDGCPQC